MFLINTAKSCRNKKILKMPSVQKNGSTDSDLAKIYISVSAQYRNQFYCENA
jgi:hypothetical protein